MSDPLRELAEEHCQAPVKGSAPLSGEPLRALLGLLPNWALDDDGAVARDFRFTDFHATMAFVNAVAWVAHQQDHHPDLQIGYNHCRVQYSTHAIGGLSRNDFICAARIEALLIVGRH